MIDRLVELLYRAHHNASCVMNEGGSEDECLEEEARYLIKYGMIVPPCKVGDMVYYLGGIHKSLVKSATVEEIIAGSNGVSDLLVNSENGVTFEDSVDVFYFTREEAEQALKRR